MRIEPQRLIAAILGGLIGLPLGADAQDGWSGRKCDLYANAWRDVLATRDLRDVSAGFIARHQAFVDGGCPGTTRICLQNPADIALADLLTVLSMNEGMASTFVPFGCPDRD